MTQRIGSELGDGVNTNNCRNASQNLFSEKNMYNLSLAFQIKAGADPDEARAAVQGKGGADPARVSCLQSQRGQRPVTCPRAHLSGARACVLKLHGPSLLCFSLPSVLSLRLLFPEDTWFLSMEIPGTQDLYFVFMRILRSCGRLGHTWMFTYDFQFCWFRSQNFLISIN